ncbi:MAG: hypothetical protein MJE63_10770 [Proteobacteria bacterium]|nr:hypothetical protein [Pseudomonadota bacterium]
MISSIQSNELPALIQNYRSQLYLDFMIKGFAVLTNDIAGHNLRLTEYEALLVAESANSLVDQMIKRVEGAFIKEFCKPKDL